MFKAVSVASGVALFVLLLPVSAGIVKITTIEPLEGVAFYSGCLALNVIISSLLSLGLVAIALLLSVVLTFDHPLCRSLALVGAGLFLPVLIYWIVVAFTGQGKK